MAKQNLTGDAPQIQQQVVSIAQALAAEARMPGFWSDHVTLSENPLVDLYIREWWPQFYHQAIEITRAVRTGHGHMALASWIEENRAKIAVVKFLTDEVDCEKLLGRTEVELRRLLDCALAAVTKNREAGLVEFLKVWVPQVLQETYSQLCYVGQILDQMAGELEDRRKAGGPLPC